jgi:acetoin utilization protein AcuB
MARYTVQRFMSASPVVIESERTLSEAHQLMRDRRIRHLPVVERGEVVGIVSQRDLYLLGTLRGVDIASETVEEAMTSDPYTVAPDSSLEEVAREMAEHKYGAAVVVEGKAPVGIFTTVDALRALSTLLRRSKAPVVGATDNG